MTQVSPDMVERAAKELEVAFHEHADGPEGSRNIAMRVLTAALGDTHVIVPTDISDARLNSLLGRAENARVTPMHTMFRDFYRLVIAGGKSAPTPSHSGQI